MPFASQAQQRFAFGTGQPWAKRWADETDFSKLPKRVRRIRSRKVKGCTCKALGEETTAKPSAAGGGKGQSLGPGITRIRGNLCNVHGRYGPCDAAASKKPKGGKGRAAKPKKAPKTPEQKRAEQEQRKRDRAEARTAEQQANRAAVNDVLAHADAAVAPTGIKAILAAADGSPIDPKTGAELAALGMAEQNPDGSYRLSQAANALVSAMDRGDTRAALDAIGRGGSRAQAAGQRASAAETRRQEREAAQAERERKRAERQAKLEARRAKRGGSGSGSQRDKPEKPGITAGAPPPRRGASGGGGGSAGGGGSYTAPEKPKPEQPKEPAAEDTGLAPELRDAARKLSAGEPMDETEVQALVRNGLARIVDGKPVLTAAGLRATKKEYIECWIGGNGSSWQPDLTPTLRNATRKERRARFKAARTHHKEYSISVYKDASGVDRWLTASSTAYRDRDREIVSTKALTGAVALADASGYRGPLRFWHVPGVELGDCDYQATAHDGRFLIESGTFRSPAIAAAVKAHAGDYRVSIGFTHPADEPDKQGVFHHIAIFERSLVPAGRASNPFTQLLVTKEQRMLTPEKEAELKEFTKEQPGLLEQLLSNITQTDKAAQDGGVAYKDATDIRAIIRQELASLLASTKETDAETEKETPPFVADEAKADMPMEMMDMAEDAAEAEVGDENMLTEAEVQAIAAAVVAAITPLLDMEKKMSGYINEMKGLMGGLSTQKDAAIAEVKSELETVKAQVADLSGSQPRILAGGYRASTAAVTVTTDETKLKAAQPAADPVAQSFGAFMSDLGLPGPVAGA